MQNSDATVEVAYRLNVDPKKQTNKFVGAVVLPNGTGKNTNCLVFAKGDKAKEAEAAGADFAGDERHGSKNPKTDGLTLT